MCVLFLVFQLPNSGLADFDTCIGRFAEIEGVVIESKLLARYEKFARETLGVQADLTKRDSDNYIAGLSPIQWCEYTVKYDGKSADTDLRMRKLSSIHDRRFDRYHNRRTRFSPSRNGTGSYNETFSER